MFQTRIISLIVAIALFMENMDSTVIATSLPAIAADIGTHPLALKLAVTSYLLSLAIFIPASGWTADRFGARSVFRAAIAVFIIGSIACALAGSLEQFVAARMLQGAGGAMMTPVGRLVLVRSVDRRALVGAMVWVTIPGLIGPIAGPPIGGFITTYASWHWIFLINVPIGLIGILLVGRYIPDIRAEARAPFDGVGFVLSGLGVSGVAFGFSVAGFGFLSWQIVLTLIGGGAIFVALYIRHSRRVAFPVLDLTLLRIPTFRANIIGGSIFRIGVGALPFLLPLLLQIGFNYTPFESGLVTFASAIGALTMKAGAVSILSRFGFRRVLMVCAAVSSLFIAACAGFSADTPVVVMMAVLVAGGFARSLQFTSVNAIAYADLDAARMSRATSLVSVAQQLSVSTGVAIGAFAVEASMWFRGSSMMTAADFPPAFIAVGLISASSAFLFARLPPEAGAALAPGRGPSKAGAADPPDTPR